MIRARWMWPWDFRRESGVLDLSIGVSYMEQGGGHSVLIYLLVGMISVQWIAE